MKVAVYWLAFITVLAAGGAADAQSQSDKPYLPIGIFIGRIEEGARIFTPVRMLPLDHPESAGHAFPTLQQLHGNEFQALLWLGNEAGLRLWATLQRYPREPDPDWPYAEFRQLPDTAILRSAVVVHRSRRAAQLPGLRAILYDGSDLLLFIVDTRSLTLAERRMKMPTSMGLDVTRSDFLAALDRGIQLAGSGGLKAVIFDK